MTFVRLARWIILLAALITSITWSYTAINHLLDSSMTPQQRVSQYDPAVQPEAEHTQQMKLAQKKWGRQSMFAVACSFLMLLVVLMNWVLDGRRPLRN